MTKEARNLIREGAGRGFELRHRIPSSFVIRHSSSHSLNRDASQDLYRSTSFLGLLHWVQRRFTRPWLGRARRPFRRGLAGLDTDHNASYQAFALLTCLLVVALCFTGAFRARFSVTRRLPRFGTAGCSFQLPRGGAESDRPNTERADPAGEPGQTRAPRFRIGGPSRSPSKGASARSGSASAAALILSSWRR